MRRRIGDRPVRRVAGGGRGRGAQRPVGPHDRRRVVGGVVDHRGPAVADVIVIDGILYLMGCLAEKGRSLSTLRAIRGAASPEKAQRLIAEALPALVAAAMTPTELELVRRHFSQLPEPAKTPRLSGRDWRGAAGVFLLVVLSTCPVVIPFAVMQNAMRAHRVSNVIAIFLLFLTGYAFGRCTGYHPKATGLAMVALGGVLVGLTILLGG